MELKREIEIGEHRKVPLLIVPYGIETMPAVVLPPRPEAFNRTLWN